jgi:hypothetical protein
MREILELLNGRCGSGRRRVTAPATASRFDAAAKDNLKSPPSGMGVDCNRKFADLAPKDAVAWHHPAVETATLRRWYGLSP